MTFGLQVSDDGLDGRAAAQLALDDTEDAALLAGDEDVTGILRVVAAVSLVDIGALDRASGEPLGILDDVAQGRSSMLLVYGRLGNLRQLSTSQFGGGSD